MGSKYGNRRHFFLRVIGQSSKSLEADTSRIIASLLCPPASVPQLLLGRSVLEGTHREQIKPATKMPHRISNTIPLTIRFPRQSLVRKSSNFPSHRPG